jgi:hypothetical protein
VRDPVARRSSEANSAAVTTGFRLGNGVTAVPNVSRSERAAAKERVDIAVARPTREDLGGAWFELYGYRDDSETGIAMWSDTHTES